MPAPEKISAQWFPFYCKDGATFSVLRQRMGALGIGIYTELLMILTTTPRHHIRLETEPKRQVFVSRIGLNWETFEEFLEVVILTEKIDVNLWSEASVLFVPDLVQSLDRLYAKRVGDQPTSESLAAEYLTIKKIAKAPKSPPPAAPKWAHEPGTGVGSIERLIKVWNSCRELPECKRTAANLPDLSKVVATLQSFSEKEIEGAILALARNWTKARAGGEKLPGTFQGFVARSVDRWVDGAEADNRYKEPAGVAPTGGRANFEL